MSFENQSLSPVLNAEKSRSLLGSSPFPNAKDSIFFEKAPPARRAFFTEIAQPAWEAAKAHISHETDKFIPASSIGDTEALRRARLIIRFGFLGAVFASFYASFYLLIGHQWGALIVVTCGAGFGFVPSLLKRTNSLDLAGNALSLILILGFSALCCVEGGARGHAIAWLASVPLCALLLMGRERAGQWMVASFAACSLLVVLDLMHVKLGRTYDPKWESLVSAVGYLGFILFMFLLGVIFETGRKRAFKKMQEAVAELEASNAQLVRLNTEKSEFLGIAAHDLKNPLSVVTATAHLLRFCRDEAQTEKMAGRIVAASKRMLHLIKNLLDANAIEEGRFPMNLQCHELCALTRECVEDNMMVAAAKEITLKLETNFPCLVRADRNATIQILDNLISNAVKYSPKKTTVSLLVAAVGGKALVAVQDQGPGISTEDLKKMFGRFARLSALPTGGETSNGLGLSIVKRLAEAMHGTIQCQSELGKGATFVLRLPEGKN